MKETCIDEGTLQSYLDGELSPEKMEWVATHTAACAFCAEALREAEGESAIFAAAMVEDLNVPIPTERLRTRLDAAIAELRPAETAATRKPTWSFGAWLNSLAASFALTPQRAVAFASILAIIVFAAIFGSIMLKKRETPTVAKNDGQNQAIPAPQPQPTSEKPVEITPGPASENPDNKTNSAPPSQPAKRGKIFRPNIQPRPAPPSAQNEQVAIKNKQNDLLPGEKSYLKAIQSLEVAINEASDLNTRPALRAEYEKNLAVVNQAITATRAAAKRQPGNTDTVEFLYAAYQSKVDLLSTVAEQARLSALSRE